MPGFQVEVKSTSVIKTKLMADYPTITKAIEEALNFCKGYEILSLHIMQSKGSQDGQVDRTTA